MARITKIGFWSTSIFLGLLGFIFGFVLAVVFCVIVISIPKGSSFLDIVLMIVLVLPLLTGLGGIVTGFIFVPIANFILKLMKGFRIKIFFGSDK